MKPETPNTIEQQHAAAAMRRINAHINRSAGQHIRAVRKVRAGGPPPTMPATPTQWSQQPRPQASVVHIDTESLQDSRAIEHFGSVDQTACCPPGFCGFDARCSDRTCPGHPAHAQQRLARFNDDDSGFGAAQAPGYALVALAATACAVIVAFAIGLNA